MPLKDKRYQGPLYRALNPVYARKPLSGHGARLYGGRFNPKGTPALYTALDPVTALREASQAGNLQPTVLICHNADLGPVFDARNATALDAFDLSAKALACPGWRTAMLEGRTVPTQEMAKALIADNFIGLLVRSFAKGASSSTLNLIVWRWAGEGCTLEVIDEENRLERM